MHGRPTGEKGIFERSREDIDAPFPSSMTSQSERSCSAALVRLNVLLPLVCSLLQIASKRCFSRTSYSTEYRYSPHLRSMDRLLPLPLPHLLGSLQLHGRRPARLACPSRRAGSRLFRLGRRDGVLRARLDKIGLRFAGANGSGRALRGGRAASIAEQVD